MTSNGSIGFGSGAAEMKQTSFASCRVSGVKLGWCFGPVFGTYCTREVPPIIQRTINADSLSLFQSKHAFRLTVWLPAHRQVQVGQDNQAPPRQTAAPGVNGVSHNVMPLQT